MWASILLFAEYFLGNYFTRNQNNVLEIVMELQLENLDVIISLNLAKTSPDSSEPQSPPL